MQLQMQMHGRATARLALVPTDQLNAAKAKQRPANAQRSNAGLALWGKRLAATHSLEIADWGPFGVSDPCGPLLDMPVVMVMLVAFSEHLLCRLVLGLATLVCR